MKVFSLCVVIGTIFLLGGCFQTTGETDPNAISMADLWFGKERLDLHLASRRQELADLQGKTDELAIRLAERKKALSRLNQKLSAAPYQNSAIGAARKKVVQKARKKQRELQEREKELKELRTRIFRMKGQLAHTGKAQKKRIMEKIAACEIELEDLEEAVTKLERSIEKILVAGAAY